MIKYAKILDENTGLCEVGLGSNTQFYQSIGMVQLDVQQSDIDNEWYLTKKCQMKTDEQKKLEETERIDKLTMTSLDFINFLEASGLTLEEITAWLDKPENLRVKTQLQYCQNVFCGVACSLMPIEMGNITITKDMVITAFRQKHGEIIEE